MHFDLIIDLDVWNYGHSYLFLVEDFISELYKYFLGKRLDKHRKKLRR